VSVRWTATFRKKVELILVKFLGGVGVAQGTRQSDFGGSLDHSHDPDPVTVSSS